MKVVMQEGVYKGSHILASTPLSCVRVFNEEDDGFKFQWRV